MLDTAYYDREADIAWIPTASSGSTRVTSDEQTWGLIDHDADGTVAGIEIWDASSRIPSAVLDALPEPEVPQDLTVSAD